VSAVDLHVSGGLKGQQAAFVPTADAATIEARRLTPDPLVLHVALGDCVQVAFTNLRSVRSSFHLSMLDRKIDSSGVNAGFNSEQTVAPGGSRTYRYYIYPSARYQTALVSDFGGANAAVDPLTGVVNNALVDPALDGMYGAVEVAPAGATFTDPVSGAPTSVGAQVDVHVPGTGGYRDFTLFLADQDPRIGQNEMPYPTQVKGPALINYATAGARPDGPNMFSSAANGGDPATPLLRAYPGDPVRVHAIGVPGNEQAHSFSLGGLTWPSDPLIHDSGRVSTRGLPPMGEVDAQLDVPGAANDAVGDYFYGDLRRPFTVAGMWGLQRILDPTGCPIKGLDGLVCGSAGH
jgi:hypothetical protein